MENVDYIIWYFIDIKLDLIRIGFELEYLAFILYWLVDAFDLISSTHFLCSFNHITYSVCFGIINVLNFNQSFKKMVLFCLKGNDDLALVQTRWAFVNKDENLLTRLQNVNLSFHFEVEQQVNGMFINFFGFNGTAGVWRIKALEDCGGWMERTTVEDMDVAVRAHLCGWKFIYLNDVKVCECFGSLRIPPNI